MRLYSSGDRAPVSETGCRGFDSLQRRFFSYYGCSNHKAKENRTINESNIIEIRWHGRGGQGAVTSAELIAQAAIAQDMFAQGMPSFGPERRGAPVVSFNRIAADGSRIRNRAGIASPDIVVVLDPTLTEIAGVTNGLREGGTLIINTHKDNKELADKYGKQFRVATVDASKIAREEMGVDIVNTTMIGALIKACDVVALESMFGPIEHRFGRLAEKNVNALKRASNETVVKERIK